MAKDAYVISDLHLGAGPQDPLEDFLDDDVLTAFLEVIGTQGTDLILNGDFVDFAQIEPLGMANLPSNLLWDESASITKLDSAFQGHPMVFGALGYLLDRGGSLTVTVGNHDLDFAWSGVQRRFREMVGGNEENVLFALGATSYAGVHIEHGHRYTPENCPRDPESFILEWNGRRYLERTWGTDFLLRYFNTLKRSHRFVRYAKPTVTVAYHGLRRGWLPRRAIVDLAVFLARRGVPWHGAASVILEGEEVPPWSVVGSFEEDPWRELATEIAGHDLRTWSQEIELLPQEDRYALGNAAHLEIGADVGWANDEAATLGLIREPREERAAKRLLSSGANTHVVFGHTHQIVDGGLGGTLFNPGSWVPHLDLRAEYVREKVKNTGLSLEILKDRRLYVVERRAVRIRSDDHQAAIQLVDCT